MICNGYKTFVSELISTDKYIDDDSIEFDFSLNVTELSEDFNVIVKLFALELSKDQKHKKNHFKFFGDSGNKNHGSPMKSSGSPIPKSVTNTKTNFLQVGYVCLSLASIRQPPRLYPMQNFTLSKPLDGYLKMSLSLKVEHTYAAEGFFDIQNNDTSFWDLRWCAIRGSHFYYWRFKDDMGEKEPMAKINLKHCINPKVSFLKADQRYLCMRPNTFALVTIKPPSVSNATKLVTGGQIEKPIPNL